MAARHINSTDAIYGVSIKKKQKTMKKLISLISIVMLFAVTAIAQNSATNGGIKYPFAAAQYYSGSITSLGDTVTFNPDDLFCWLSVDADTTGTIDLTVDEVQTGSWVVVSVQSDGDGDNTITWQGDILGISSSTVSSSDTAMYMFVYDELASSLRYLQSNSQFTSLDVTGDISLSGTLSGDVDASTVTADSTDVGELNADSVTTTSIRADTANISGGAVISGTLDVGALTSVVNGVATLSDSTTDYDVSNVSVLLVDTDAESENEAIQGLTGGVQGQVLYIINIGSNNIVINDDAGTGNQDIKLAGSSDQTITGDGGLTLIFGGTYWRGMGD